MIFGYNLCVSCTLLALVSRNVRNPLYSKGQNIFPHILPDAKAAWRHSVTPDRRRLSNWKDEIWEPSAINAEAGVDVSRRIYTSCNSVCSTQAPPLAWMCFCCCGRVCPGQSPAVFFICECQTMEKVPKSVWSCLKIKTYTSQIITDIMNKPNEQISENVKLLGVKVQ